MKHRRTYRAVALSLALATISMAGDRSNIRGMAMGRTMNASSRGLDALGINPANLGWPDRNRFSFNIVSFGTRIGTDLFTYDVYQEFFTGDPGDRSKPRYLNGSDKERLLSLLPEGRGSTRMDLEILSLGFSLYVPEYGAISFGITDRIGMKFDLPREYMRMFLFGFDSTGSTYNFEGTAASAWWWREYNLSFGFEVPLRHSMVRAFVAGVGLKFLRGYGVLETLKYRGVLGVQRSGANQYLGSADSDFLMRRSGIDALDPGKNESFSVFPEPAGTGIGFDLGIGVQLISGVHLSASITDIGRISWKKNIVETSADYSLRFTDPFSKETQDSLKQAFRGKNAVGGDFSTTLPATLRLGASVLVQQIPGFDVLPGDMLLAFDYNQGLTESMGGVTTPRLSIGMEYRIIPLLPLRTGISFFGGDVVRWGAGFGLDFSSFNLELATENFAMFFSPRKLTAFSFSLGMRLGI
ncbi:MAG: hypothetical protein HW389_3367 [Bacteroidetes bacterium]|nr:hypothetical protein [Bacteroidota bacterium]